MKHAQDNYSIWYNKLMHIILGGTSGLGWELATMLRQRGQRVAVLGHDHHSEQHGEGLGVDLTNSEAVKHAVWELSQLVGDEQIQSFYWSTGFGYRGDFGGQPHPEIMATVNFSGALPIVQWVWNKMKNQLSPSNFIIVSSTSGYKPRADEAVYAGTKHAQAGMARCLGLEARQANLPVRVLLCLPGGMRTPFWDGREPEDYAHYNDPRKVAARTLQAVDSQATPYIELIMPRGTLV